jgi:hypothetical protein
MQAAGDRTLIEYGVQEQPNGEVVLIGHDDGDREEAIELAERWNKRGNRTYLAVQRTITRTAWAPFNTGVVGPHVAESEE